MSESFSGQLSVFAIAPGISKEATETKPTAYDKDFNNVLGHQIAKQVLGDCPFSSYEYKESSIVNRSSISNLMDSTHFTTIKEVAELIVAKQSSKRERMFICGTFLAGSD
ncbi:hypothetical protein [Oceanobacillus damuensis]|uniref:hypothetical protein n=1 Tax=Oceanobacillus damuensis TaxID=937928 RepID=UPI00082B1AD4|nr:hypothetical protein [Oceanobacillus damuensis]